MGIIICMDREQHDRQIIQIRKLKKENKQLTQQNNLLKTSNKRVYQQKLNFNKQSNKKTEIQLPSQRRTIQIQNQFQLQKEKFKKKQYQFLSQKALFKNKEKQSQEQKATYKKKLAQFQQQIAMYNKKEKSSEQQRATYKKKLAQFQQQIAMYKEKEKQFEEQKIKFKKRQIQFQHLKEQFKIKGNQSEQYRTRYQKGVAQFQQQRKKLQRQIKSLQQSLIQKQNVIKDLQKQRELNFQTIAFYKTKIQEKDKVKNSPQERNLRDNLEVYQKKISEYESILKEKSLKVENLSRQLEKNKQEYKKTILISQQKLKQMTLNNQNLQTQKDKLVQQLQKNSQENQLKIQQLQKNYKENQVKIQKLQKQYKQDIQRTRNQFSQISNLNQNFQQIRQEQIHPYDEMKYRDMFHAELLQDHLEYKKFLVDTLEHFLTKRIKKTKLIFKFDPLNKVNFHQYIDNKENIVLIIKTKKNFYLGGWSQGSFIPKTISSKNGLLFSLTNKKYYELKQANKKAISYDDYFLIFGNSEIRLKSLEQKLFSNFAISNAFYNNQNDKQQHLIGQTDRQILIQSYEIFQLIFHE